MCFLILQEHFFMKPGFCLVVCREKTLHPYCHIHQVARFWLVNWWRGCPSFWLPGRCLKPLPTTRPRQRRCVASWKSTSPTSGPSQAPSRRSALQFVVTSIRSILFVWISFTYCRIFNRCDLCDFYSEANGSVSSWFTNARLQEFLFRLWMDNISEENPLFQRFQPWTRQPYDQLLLEIINQGKDDLEKAWFRSEHSEELINEDGTLAVLFAKVV